MAFSIRIVPPTIAEQSMRVLIDLWATSVPTWGQILRCVEHCSCVFVILELLKHSRRHGYGGYHATIQHDLALDLADGVEGAAHISEGEGTTYSQRPM